jgi:hypothetical protein
MIYIILEKAAAVNIIEEEVNRHGKCRISVAENQFLTQLTGFSFQKYSRIRRAFDAGLKNATFNLLIFPKRLELSH